MSVLFPSFLLCFFLSSGQVFLASEDWLHHWSQRLPHISYHSYCDPLHLQVSRHTVRHTHQMIKEKVWKGNFIPDRHTSSPENKIGHHCRTPVKSIEQSTIIHMDIIPAGRYDMDNMTVYASNTLKWDLLTFDQRSWQKYEAYVKIWKTGRKIQILYFRIK